MVKKDPIKELYAELPPVALNRRTTALLVVDMQYLDAAEGYGFSAKAKELGVEECVAYYMNRITGTVVPNIRRLLQAFRSLGMEVLYTKIEALTRDGRDRSLEHKRLGLLAPKGSPEAAILDEIKPEGDEIVLPKTTSGVFNGTSIDYVLRNLGMNTLVVCGVLTNECVENAVRDAADRSYSVVLAEDCCAAITEEVHNSSVAAMGHTYCQVMQTADVLGKLSELEE